MLLSNKNLQKKDEINNDKFCDCGCNLSAKNIGFLFIGIKKRQFNCKNLTLTWSLERENYNIQLLIINKITKKNEIFNAKFEVFNDNV